MTDLEELKKLALAATPGEWKVCDESRENAVWHAGLTIYSEFGRVADVTPLSPYQSAAYIAAANPQTVLALIRELEDMKHDLERSIATSADLATELEEARRLLCEARENLYSMTDPALISRIDAAILKRAES